MGAGTHGKDNTNLKNLCLILMTLFRQENMLRKVHTLCIYDCHVYVLYTMQSLLFEKNYFFHSINEIQRKTLMKCKYCLTI